MDNHFAQSGITEKIIVLSRIIEHVANHNVLEKLGISLAGYEIMHILHFHSVSEPSVLAKFLGSGKSNITQRVNVLMKNGLITKIRSDNGDGRKAPIKLTAKGKKLFALANQRLKKETSQLEKSVGEKEVKMCSPFLDKLFAILISIHNNCCPKKILSSMKKKIILPIIIIIMATSVSGCAKKDEVKNEKQPISVTAQTVEDRRQIEEHMEYAALVYPEEEALIIAKTGGTATEVKFKLGDKVKAGDVLIKIDDASGKNPAGNYSFNASQIKQAQLAVQQAYSSLAMAQVNHQNELNSSPSIASENYRAAEITYETAKLATEQAKINLDSRQKQGNLSNGDATINSATAADAAANACDTIINGLDTYLNLGDSISNYLPYASDLSALDSSILRQAKDAYRLTKIANDSYKSATFTDTTTQVKTVIDLASKTKNVTDYSKKVLDKTSSLKGNSLSALIEIVNGYQAQANAALAQANGAKQALENTDLDTAANLKLLQKAYELAQKQETAAWQNLNTLKISQANQLNATELQYKNAVAVLQGLYDSHISVSPISGIITRKEIDNGSTVSLGQTLASVSQTDKVKIQFFVDEDNLKYLSPGQEVEIINNGGETIPGKIFNLTPQADQISKKFLVEVKPDNAASAKLTAGTVVNIAVSLKKKAVADNAIILPLSAVEITQNNNYIFIIKDNIAQKTPVKIIKVDGENAQIEFTGDAKDLIITDGNKLVREGDLVKIQ
jgi:RND family efflux transporter MFP subunit